MTSSAASIVWLVVARHVEDAAFTSCAKDAEALAPSHVLRDAIARDGRLAAHLDGLRIAGQAGWKALAEEHGWAGPGELFVGTVLACEAGDEGRFAQVLEAAGEELELARGIGSGLGWIEWAQAEPFARRLVQSEQPLHRRVGVAAFAVHRKDPGTDLGRWIDDTDPLVRARALRAVGELGRVDLLGRVKQKATDTDPACRFWSAWSATLLGDPAAVNVLRAMAESGGPFAERAADLAARKLSAKEAIAWRQALARDPGELRLAIKVAAAHGDPVCVPWLIEQMTGAAAARVAGEALSSITGVDLDYSDLDGSQPEGFESGPNDDPKDENVALDPDEDLPFPSVERVQAWWARERGRFAPGVRHLLGRPTTPDNARLALREGKQRQRAAAALELVLAQPGSVLFEVRERADRQLARL